MDVILIECEAAAQSPSAVVAVVTLHVADICRGQRDGESSLTPLRSENSIPSEIESALVDDSIVACYIGDYPTELVNIEELIAARQKRK